MKIGCVLMAAGLATRFGENKLLYKIEGRSLLARAMQAAPPCLFARAVTVASDAQVAAGAAAAGYDVHMNPNPQRGQGGTIALGMQGMQDMDAVMFCVADQPYLTQHSVTRLLAAYRPGSILSLAYGGRRGNPVVFPHECFAALAALAPEETGRVVIRAHPDLLTLMQASEERELWDVDTREDLQRFHKTQA